jgi:hypothetical protein
VKANASLRRFGVIFGDDRRKDVGIYDGDGRRKDVGIDDEYGVRYM